MIEHFGSLRTVFAAAPREQLRAAGGDKRIVAQLKAVRQAMLWQLRERVEERPFLGNQAAVIDYLRLAQGFAPLEEIRLFHLDAKARLLREEIFPPGAPDETGVHIRAIIGQALEIGSVFLVLVHNHPSGDSTPSAADKDLTRRLSATAHALGIRLVDHLIVAADGCYSFREAGIL